MFKVTTPSVFVSLQNSASQFSLLYGGKTRITTTRPSPEPQERKLESILSCHLIALTKNAFGGTTTTFKGTADVISPAKSSVSKERAEMAQKEATTFKEQEITQLWYINKPLNIWSDSQATKKGTIKRFSTKRLCHHLIRWSWTEASATSTGRTAALLVRLHLIQSLFLQTYYNWETGKTC